MSDGKAYIGLGGGVSGGPARELYFHERNADQKIQKLAEAVEYLAVKLLEAHKIIEALENHSHSGSAITVPLNMATEENREFNPRYATYFFKNPLGKEMIR